MRGYRARSRTPIRSGGGCCHICQYTFTTLQVFNGTLRESTAVGCRGHEVTDHVYYISRGAPSAHSTIICIALCFSLLVNLYPINSM